MKLTSVFKAPEASVVTGIGLGGAVLAIYGHALPPASDIRSADPHNVDVESSRKQAAWLSASLLGLVFLMTRDVNSLLIGGAALAGIDLMTKHANGVHPSTGKLVGRNDANTPPADNSEAYPLADYDDQSPSEEF